VLFILGEALAEDETRLKLKIEMRINAEVLMLFYRYNRGKDQVAEVAFKF